MEIYFCKYCGARGLSLKMLTMGRCPKAPRHFHVPYTGTPKAPFVCRYCGARSGTIMALTGMRCSKSPSGFHIPM